MTLAIPAVAPAPVGRVRWRRVYGTAPRRFRYPVAISSVCPIANPACFPERDTGFEPVTPSLGSEVREPIQNDSSGLERARSGEPAQSAAFGEARARLSCTVVGHEPAGSGPAWLLDAALADALLSMALRGIANRAALDLVRGEVLS
jgi:hypothetical protein